MSAARVCRVLLCRPLHPAGMALLDARPDVEAVGLATDADRAALLDAVREADAMLAWLERVDAELLDAAPRLRVVSRYGVGTDTVDLDLCAARGVPVMVVNGTNDLSVAEHAVMLLLAVSRRATETDRAVRAGVWWGPSGPPTRDLAGRTALVVRLGRIGARVARLLSAFGMRVLVHDPGLRPDRIAADGYAAAADLLAALGGADAVTLHCPLTPATRHLMGEAAFAAMRPGAVLVNTARGGLVDERALLAALDSGRLAGAGLDVFEAEPPGAANPLLSHPNVVASPHSAASTQEGLARMAERAARNILDALDGRPDPAMVANGVVPGADGRG